MRDRFTEAILACWGGMVRDRLTKAILTEWGEMVSRVE